MEPPLYFSRSKPPCRLSYPAHPHKLRRQRPGSFSMCFTCKGKHLDSTYYYYCATCNLEFHIGCHIILPEIRHPFHPSHTLTLISLSRRFEMSKIPQLFWSHTGNDGNAYYCDNVAAYNNNDEVYPYGSCDEEEDDGCGAADDCDDDDDDGDDDDDDDVVSTDDGDDDDDDDDDGGGGGGADDGDDVVSTDDDGDASLSDGTHRKCKCCGDRLEMTYYHCSICKFNLNLTCAKIAPPPTTISHLKSHEHTLTLFPIRLPLPCDACGLSLNDTEDLVYACLPCSHMVHRSCIYLPRVIQITRHRHRLSLTSSLPPGDFACGVCRKTVDVNYGQYSCNKGCHYAVHSKCATRKDVWDGKDLEGVPEEPYEDIEPFARIDEETIQHFSHEHYLRLHEKKTICEKDKFCEACTLPIMISQRFYGCMQCDFVLDEACASLPRKSYNPLHKHPLILHPSPSSDFFIMEYNTSGRYIFKCDGCHRLSCGFMYNCSEKDCQFRLDVRCASLPDPLIHGCHPHDLFFNLTRGNCMRCGSDECSSYFLECIKCKLFLGITCATLPSKAHYKHDRHPLTLCYGEEEDTTRGQYWCEKCESKIDPKTWFYTCDCCRITLHVNCLLWKGMNLKPHHIIQVDHDDGKVEIARNDGNSRLRCSNCNLRCEQTFVFNRIGRYHSYCSFTCVGEFFEEAYMDILRGNGLEV